MGNSFDEYARRAAKKKQGNSTSGVSRRTIVRGAAWSAPVLMAAGAVPAFAASPGDLGGFCGNQGVGQCNNPYKCNGNDFLCNGCAQPNICGGEGSVCTTSEQCDPSLGLQCTPDLSADGQSYCRRPCADDGGCAAGQVCSDGYCAKACTRDNQCTGACVDEVCTYDGPNNI